MRFRCGDVYGHTNLSLLVMCFVSHARHFLFVFVHQASASWMSALLIQHLKTIILKQMWWAKFLRHCAPVAASAGLTIGNATPIFCVGDAEPKRIEAKIYADWRHTFPWLELTDKGIGCKSCMALTEGAKAKVNGQKKFLYGIWCHNTKYSFSSQIFTSHFATPTHQGAARRQSGYNPFTFSVSSTASASSSFAASAALAQTVLVPEAKPSQNTSSVKVDSSSFGEVPCIPEGVGAAAPVHTGTPCHKQWANTAALVYLKMNRLSSYPEWREDLAFNARRNCTYLHDHSSVTNWNEFVAELVAGIEKTRFEAMQKSPVIGISFDTKSRDLAVCLHYLDTTGKDFCFVSLPLCRVKVAGETAQVMAHALVQALGERGIDKLRLGAVGADGASVTGVMTAEQLEVTPFGNLSASNVCKELAKEVGASVLCHHCCAHKVQLAAGDSWNKILYLKQLEKRIRSLHKHLKLSGKAVHALIFLSAASGGGPVSELHFACSRCFGAFPYADYQPQLRRVSFLFAWPA